MFENRSLYFESTHALAKLGYEHLAKDLLEQVLHALKRDELNESQRQYLIECLTHTLSTGDAQKGFLLKSTRGKKKKPTGMRDQTATMLMIMTEGQDYSYEERLKQVADHINKEFSDNIGPETVEAVFTKNKSKVLADIERSAAEEEGLFIRVK